MFFDIIGKIFKVLFFASSEHITKASFQFLWSLEVNLRDLHAIKNGMLELSELLFKRKEAMFFKNILKIVFLLVVNAEFIDFCEDVFKALIEASRRLVFVGIVVLEISEKMLHVKDILVFEDFDQSANIKTKLIKMALCILYFCISWCFYYTYREGLRGGIIKISYICSSKR